MSDIANNSTLCNFVIEITPLNDSVVNFLVSYSPTDM
jgi:hypothetical protein